MTLGEIAKKLGFKYLCGEAKAPVTVTGGYACDLLSDVMAHTKPGDIWVTRQVHENIVAVASLKDLAGIVLVNGRQPEEKTIQKAEQEGIALLLSELPAFEVVGRLYQEGVRGT